MHILIVRIWPTLVRKNIGVDEEAVTDDMISRALQANNEFIRALEQIRDRAQEEGNGYDASPITAG
jgi:hypothetical protein